MISLGFPRWLYPLLSWCGEIPFSDQQLRPELKFYFFCFDADNWKLGATWSFQILTSNWDFCFWSGFSNGSLEQWTFQILTLLVKLLPNKETEMAVFIIEYVCTSLVVTLVEVCQVCHSLWGLQIW
jgi:hypothetical protein